MDHIRSPSPGSFGKVLRWSVPQYQSRYSTDRRHFDRIKVMRLVLYCSDVIEYPQYCENFESFEFKESGIQ